MLHYGRQIRAVDQRLAEYQALFFQPDALNMIRMSSSRSSAMAPASR